MHLIIQTDVVAWIYLVSKSCFANDRNYNIWTYTFGRDHRQFTSRTTVTVTVTEAPD